MKIWLDDIREPLDETWTWVKSAHEFAKLLDEYEGVIEEISFDHDLASYDLDGNELTGYTCVRWVEKKLKHDVSFDPPCMWVHSQNPVGRANIEFVISRIERLKTIG